MPRQVSTGRRSRLVGISKRGNQYLRKQLVHGARATLPDLLRAATPLGAWLRALMVLRHEMVFISRAPAIPH